MSVQRWVIGEMQMRGEWWPVVNRDARDIAEAKAMCEARMTEKADVEAVRIEQYEAGPHEFFGKVVATWLRERGDDLWREERR